MVWVLMALESPVRALGQVGPPIRILTMVGVGDGVGDGDGDGKISFCIFLSSLEFERGWESMDENLFKFGPCTSYDMCCPQVRVC